MSSSPSPEVMTSPALDVAPYHPPPTNPPPAAVKDAATDARAAASLLFAILGLLFAIPLGLPGMIAGPIAYFLGKGARERIKNSNGSLGGAGAANTGRILGVVAMAVGAAVTLIWLIVIFNALNDVGTSSGF